MQQQAWCAAKNITQFYWKLDDLSIGYIILEIGKE